ncbi:MAG: hypothetical protein JNL01_00325 [Bdellovibrionales bacterium]|nr:hypothetical protein [Bdellovibrionales bacterium]
MTRITTVGLFWIFCVFAQAENLAHANTVGDWGIYQRVTADGSQTQTTIERLEIVALDPATGRAKVRVNETDSLGRNLPLREIEMTFDRARQVGGYAQCSKFRGKKTHLAIAGRNVRVCRVKQRLPGLLVKMWDSPDTPLGGTVKSFFKFGKKIQEVTLIDYFYQGP